MKFAAVLNSGAGTLLSLDPESVRRTITDSFAARGHEISIELVEGVEVETAVQRHVRAGKVDGVIVGGGDGSVSSTAHLLRGRTMAMGILPLGTMNLYARSLGVPFDLTTAAKALAEAEIRPVDVGEANGRTFIHQVSLGLQPRLAELRDKMKYRSRLGKIMAGTKAFLLVARDLRALLLTVELDGQTTVVKTPAVVISNNLYGALPYAGKLDGGVLGYYAMSPTRWSALVRLTADVMTGRWQDNPNVDVRAARRVTIAPRGRRKWLRASVDGELVKFEGAVDIRIRPGALKLLVPQAGLAAISKPAGRQ